MCHCQPHTLLKIWTTVLIFGFQNEVLPFSPLWLYLRSALSFSFFFASVSFRRFFHLFFHCLAFPLWASLDQGWRSSWTGKVLYEARCVCFCEGAAIWFPRSGSNCGTEGATLVFYMASILDKSPTTQMAIALPPRDVALDKRTRDRGSGS